MTARNHSGPYAGESCMPFQFATANRIRFGEGIFAELGQEALMFGCGPLIVAGGSGRFAEEVEALLRAEFSRVEPAVFAVDREPDIELIQRGVAVAKQHGADLVIAVGGGAAIDAGKAIAALATNDGDLLDYLEVVGRGQPLRENPLPCIAVPTTAGTGSEVTRNAVIGSPEHGVKVSLRHELMLPDLALVDPELTYGLPPQVTAFTGLDALTQLLEPLVCSRANPVTDALCREGLGRLRGQLEAAFDGAKKKTVGSADDDAVRQARHHLAIASLFGGLALANSGLGAVHGIAGPFGGMFAGAPHGAVCAALLPHVTRLNIARLRKADGPAAPALARYEQAASLLLGEAVGNRSADEAIDQLVNDLRRLVAHCEIPPLRAYGFNSEHFAELAEKAAQASSMKANPVSLTREDLFEIFQQAG